MATTKVRFDFVCGQTKLTFNHDMPTSLIQASAAGNGPAFRQAYVQAVFPIMQQHKEACLKASQAECSVCEISTTKQVLTTPMSYLHQKDDPNVVVVVTPVCEKPQCDVAAKAMVNEMVSEITGLRPGEVKVSENGPISRNAHCPCGSSRKYKKCCGSTDAQNDVD